MNVNKFFVAIAAIAAANGIYRVGKFLFEPKPITDDQWEAMDFDPTSEWHLTNNPFYEKWKEVPMTYETFVVICKKIERYFRVKYFSTRKVVTAGELSQADLALLNLASLEDAMNKAIEYHPDEVSEELGIVCPFQTNALGHVYFNFSLNLDDVRQDSPWRMEEAKQEKKMHNANVQERRKLVRSLCTQTIEQMMCRKETAKLTAQIFLSDDINGFPFKSIHGELINTLYLNAVDGLPRNIKKEVENIRDRKLKQILA